MLGRTETRTRDMMYCQTKRTVRDISRFDRAIIAICSLRTPTEIRRIKVLCSTEHVSDYYRNRAPICIVNVIAY